MRWLLFALALCISPTVSAEESALAPHFGFGPMQIYKIDDGIRHMRIADLDRDGRNDIALWNRWKNQIELFHQDAPSVSADASETDGDNEILDRGSMRRSKIPVAASVEALQIADVTGDGNLDLLHFGEPRELVVHPGKPGGGFGSPISYRAAGGDPRSGGLAVGDFNGDGRSDVALRGENQILLFHQTAEGRFAKPKRLQHGISDGMLLLAADINADGRDDLLMSVDDETFGMVVFLQAAEGLGPLQQLRLPRVRSITVTGSPLGGDELFCIESTTNRLRQLRWQEADTTRADDWPMRLYSYPIGGKARKRPIAVGDVTGDGLDDVVALDGKSAQMVLFRGGASGLLPGEVFPGLADATSVSIEDVDGNGQGDVVLVSKEEKAVGVSSYQDGRLSYPKLLELDGKPGVATAHAGKLWVVVTKDGKQSLTMTAFDGSASDSWPIEKLSDDPTGIRIADLNQDGRLDVLVFVAFAAPRAWLRQEDGQLVPLAGEQLRSGLVERAAWNNHTFADMDGDGKTELVVAEEKRARSLRIADGSWTVVDQYNPDDGDAQFGGLTVVQVGSGAPLLVAYERRQGRLLVMKRSAAGTYEVTRSQPVGSFEDPQMVPVRIGVDQKPAVLLADSRKLAVLEPTRTAPGLEEVASYSSPLRNVWLADAVIGDFNHDQVRDVLVVDMRRAFLELLTQSSSGFRAALQFQVFQGKRFSDEPDRGGEPHQVLAADVTGDGIDDLTLLVHDRLIIYPGQ